jgi:Na+/melibiose symporter-like transporter
VLGVWCTLPWLVVYAVTWERPNHVVSTVPFLLGVRRVFAHRTYQRLLLLFLGSRMAMDLSGAMFVFYLTYWLQRPEDFPIVMGLMLLTGTFVLPLWLRAARRFDKSTVFVIGLAIWIAALLVIQQMDPTWPRWSMWVLAALVGVGFAAGDLMPWSMLGDVIDEDELRHGERRDGIYAGVFTFLRKLGGAAAVAVGGQFLDLAGFVPGRVQSPEVLTTIRLLTAAIPALLLFIAAMGSFGYPLDKERHDEILRLLDSRPASGH